jgi:hypothetical protein
MLSVLCVCLANLTQLSFLVRHLCLCKNCATVMRFERERKCPIYRGGIKKLARINFVQEIAQTLHAICRLLCKSYDIKDNRVSFLVFKSEKSVIHSSDVYITLLSREYLVRFSDKLSSKGAGKRFVSVEILIKAYY